MQYDDLYKALADEHRREIVTALCEQPVVAGDLARRVGLAPNALSFHLKWLRSAGLIDMQRRGRHLWYHLNAPKLSAWQDHVNSSFRAQPFVTSSTTMNSEPIESHLVTHHQETSSAAQEHFLPDELL